MDFIKKFFKLEERNTNLKTEILAGVTTFLTMMYILPVNAGMLSTFTPELYGQFFLATALAAIVATLVMGLVANFPIALAPGMGINAFFTFTIVLSLILDNGKAPIEAIGFALAAVFVSGLIFLLISVTGLREKVIQAIPKNLKFAVGAGIGFFIAFIGLKNTGLIVADGATFVTFGNFSNPVVLMSFIGLLIGLVFIVRRNKFAVILTMAIMALSGTILGLIFPEYIQFAGEKATGTALGFFDIKGMSVSLDGLGLSEIFGLCFKYITEVLTSPLGYFAIFTFLFVDFFDTTGTLLAVGNEAGLVDEEGNIEGGSKALLADSIGTVVGSVLGTSTTTSFIESASGVKQGGRTGLSSIVVVLLFALAIPLWKVFDIFNQPVTGVALILVGVMMAGQLKNIDFEDEVAAVCAFFIIIIMILSYSIFVGIAVGFIMYSVLKLAKGEGKEVSIFMYGVSLFSVAYFVLDAMQELGYITL